MKSLIVCTAIGVSLIVLSDFGRAAPPSNAPLGTTGLCNDGSYFSGPTKKGACRSHKGVKEWYGTQTNAPAPATGPAAPKLESPVAGAAAPKVASPATGPAAPKAASPGAIPPPGIATGPGGVAVWANKGTNVYRCPGDKWYGNTKEGEYMPEAVAKSQGFKPERGKTCK